jgi:hypothetical protein
MKPDGSLPHSQEPATCPYANKLLNANSQQQVLCSDIALTLVKMQRILS